MNFSKKLIPVLLAVIAICMIITGASIIKSAQASRDESRYEYLQTFSQALSIVENNYVESVEDKTLMYGAIKGMLHELDPYSTFLDPRSYKEFQVETQGEFGGLGITIGLRDKTLTVIAPLEDTPAFRAGIKAGDKIIKIEDENTMGMTLSEAVDILRGKPGTKVNITILRESRDKPFEVTITRAIIKIKSVKYKMIEDNIGYVRLIQFQNNVSSELADALKDMDNQGAEAFIVDLRNNPGGFLSESIKVSSIFLKSKKSVVYTKDRNGREQHYNSSIFSHKETDKPLVVLVNEGSASASEIFSGAIQDHERGVLVGKKTFGKASVQSIINLKDGSAIKLTTARYYTPDGRMIHETGLEPDFAVELEEVELTEEQKEKMAANSSAALADVENDSQLRFALKKIKEKMESGR